jgi:hypothetical protein
LLKTKNEKGTFRLPFPSLNVPFQIKYCKE